MTSTTRQYTLQYGMGYTGKFGKRPYLARILGSDVRYGLRREFVEADRAEREHFNRPRTTVTLTYTIEVDGLYEIEESSERRIIYVYAHKDTGELKTARASDARVKAWIALLDEGKTDHEARLATKGIA